MTPLQLSSMYNLHKTNHNAYPWNCLSTQQNFVHILADLLTNPHKKRTKKKIIQKAYAMTVKHVDPQSKQSE